MIETRQSFIFETTLSSNHALRMMSDAKAAGFHVNLLYVALDTVERNIERVRSRVRKGGHNIREDVIRRRYARSLDNLAKALKLADEAALIDNSGLDPHIAIEMKAATVATSSIDERNPLHNVFMGAVCKAFDLVWVDRSFRRSQVVQHDIDDLTNQILNAVPGYKPSEST